MKEAGDVILDLSGFTTGYRNAIFPADHGTSQDFKFDTDPTPQEHLNVFTEAYKDIFHLVYSTATVGESLDGECLYFFSGWD